jgi:hypothetical protein
MLYLFFWVKYWPSNIKYMVASFQTNKRLIEHVKVPNKHEKEYSFSVIGKKKRKRKAS